MYVESVIRWFPLNLLTGTRDDKGPVSGRPFRSGCANGSRYGHDETGSAGELPRALRIIETCCVRFDSSSKTVRPQRLHELVFGGHSPTVLNQQQHWCTLSDLLSIFCAARFGNGNSNFFRTLRDLSGRDTGDSEANDEFPEAPAPKWASEIVGCRWMPFACGIPRSPVFGYLSGSRLAGN
jgi:hypothetical protein